MRTREENRREMDVPGRVGESVAGKVIAFRRDTGIKDASRYIDPTVYRMTVHDVLPSNGRTKIGKGGNRNPA